MYAKYFQPFLSFITKTGNLPRFFLIYQTAAFRHQYDKFQVFRSFEDIVQMVWTPLSIDNPPFHGCSLCKFLSKPLIFLIFSKFIIFTFKNYFTLFKIMLYIWRKIMFFCRHKFVKKVILSCLKMTLCVWEKKAGVSE